MEDKIIEYKCPACGGALAFDSKTQKMKCPYCDSEYDPEDLKNLDEGLQADEPDNMQWQMKEETTFDDSETEGIHVYACESCGGEIIGDETTGATSCPFCGNPVVMKEAFRGDLRPNLVIPFKKSKEDAKNTFFSFVKSKLLVPKIFKNKKHIEEIKGMYVPFWLYDAEADGRVRYHGTKIRTWSDSDYNYTETSHYSIYRAGSLAFDDIPADGSTKMPDELMESIEPFDMKEGVDFQTAYLAGYLADRYDVTSEDCAKRVNERAKESMEMALRSTVHGYASVVKENSSVSLAKGEIKYALLPVWILTTKWKDKPYTFAMNGQTGKFVGNLPIDWGAYWKWFAIIAAVAAPILFLLLHFVFGL